MLRLAHKGRDDQVREKHSQRIRHQGDCCGEGTLRVREPCSRDLGRQEHYERECNPGNSLTDESHGEVESGRQERAEINNQDERILSRARTRVNLTKRISPPMQLVHAATRMAVLKDREE